MAGTCSPIWNEAQTLWGRDPDLHRHEMWNDIENGDALEWELGIQVIEAEDEMNFDFDILDPTQLIPEEEGPDEKIGKLTLDRNPDNYFAETERVAFSPGHIGGGALSAQVVRQTAARVGTGTRRSSPALRDPGAAGSQRAGRRPRFRGLRRTGVR